MSAAYMRRCARKRRYESKDEAAKARSVVAALGNKARKKVNAYRCDQCLGWHVGKADGHYISRNRTGKRPNKRMRGRV